MNSVKRTYPVFFVLLITAVMFSSYAFSSFHFSAPTPATETPAPADTQAAGETPTAAGASLPTVVPVIIQITGSLENLSGAPLPDSPEITLHGYDSMDESYSTTTKALSDGTFVFDHVESIPGRIFVATAAMNGVIYSSEMSSHPSTTGTATPEATTNINLPIKIYPISHDVSALSIARLHIYFTFETTGKIQVVEMILLSNPTQAIIAPEEGKALFHLDLPADAEAAQFMDTSGTEGVTQSSQGIDFKKQVMPGDSTSQLIFSFELPYADHLDYSQSLPIKVITSNIMIPTAGITLKGASFKDNGLRTSQGMNFHLYSSDSLETGKPVEFSLTGKPQSGTSSGLDSSMDVIFIGGALFVLSLISLGFLLNRQRKLNQHTARLKTLQKDDTDRNALLEAIIALDDLYKAGKLDEKVYTQRRKALKDQLKEVVEQNDRES
jgi:hypothetical protein